MRAKYGLEADLPTVMLSLGGFGVGRIETLLDGLRAIKTPVQILAMCGKNEELKTKLEREQNANRTARVIPVGYTRDMDEYMSGVRPHRRQARRPDHLRSPRKRPRLRHRKPDPRPGRTQRRPPPRTRSRDPLKQSRYPRLQDRKTDKRPATPQHNARKRPKLRPPQRRLRYRGQTGQFGRVKRLTVCPRCIVRDRLLASLHKRKIYCLPRCSSRITVGPIGVIANSLGYYRGRAR